MIETTLEVWVGESKEWTLYVETAGEPDDLTNAEIAFTVKRREGADGAAVILLTVGSGITIDLDQSPTSPTRGTAKVVLPSHATTPGEGKPTPGNWRHETMVQWPGPPVRRKYPVRGDFILKAPNNPPAETPPP